LYADLVIHNGTIITLNEAKPIASALAIKDGKILQVGIYEELEHLLGEHSKKIDLHGKTAVPGFIDSHIHLISLGLDMQVIDLSGTHTKSEILSRLEKTTMHTPTGNWVKGYGFEESKLDGVPNLSDLDLLFQTTPFTSRG
jgi:predicted amidohydrolase YtcJ